MWIASIAGWRIYNWVTAISGRYWLWTQPRPGYARDMEITEEVWHFLSTGKLTLRGGALTSASSRS